MKRLTALLLVLFMTLGLFAYADDEQFTPAAPESPSDAVTSAEPFAEPSSEPSAEPSEEPDPTPSEDPSVEPSNEPGPKPSDEPVPEQPAYPETVEPEEYVVRVGLFYGSTALASANLQNVTGAGKGYLFGSFDSDGTFHAVEETEEVQITVSAGIYSTTSYVVTNTNTGEKLFEYDKGSESFGILPIGADDPITWHKGFKWSGGFEYRRNSNGRLSVINVVEIGDYTKGVIPYEIGTSWGEEGTKVGAICASSFAVFNRNRHRKDGFSVCNTDHCQVYKGHNSATANTNTWCEAVADEALFYNGAVCNTVYHSTNGGWTESAKNVWGGEIAYLQAVEDTYEDLDRALHGRWSFNYSGEDISWILTQKGKPIGVVVKAWVELTEAGNVYRISFEDASGKRQSFSGESARTILCSDTLGKYTYSQRYNIASGGPITLSVGETGGPVAATGVSVIGKDGVSLISDPAEVYVLTASGTDVLRGSGASGGFVISGTGWGHNVGLSQWGSRGRASAGWTYKQILEYYYTGAKVQKISEVLG